jgi:hypothetical protein
VPNDSGNKQRPRAAGGDGDGGPVPRGKAEITHGDQQEGVKAEDLAVARSRRSAGRSAQRSASEGREQGGERDAERTAVRQDRFTGDPGSHSGARATRPSQARFPLRHSTGTKGLTITTALGDALEAFILEHEYCGELDAGVEEDRVWMTCTCGAVINRPADHD